MKRLLILILCLATPLCATNGFQQIGRGTKAQGVGGAAIAFPQDSMAQAANPAGLVFLCDRLDAGLTYVDERGPLWWPEVSGKIDWWKDQALGGAIYVYGGFDEHYIKYGAAFFSPAWAWRINRCHAVGVALNFALEWFEAFDLQELEANSVAPTRVTNRGRTVEWGINARIGWIGTPCRGLKLGLTYQTPTVFSLLRKYRGLIPGGGEIYLPQEFGFGVAVTPRRWLTLALDLVELLWRDSAFFRNGNQGVYGADNGPGLNWHNQLVVKVGTALRPFSCLTLRAGYNYGRSPHPDYDLFNFDTPRPLRSTVGPNLEHHITAGGTLAIRCHELSVAGVFGFSSQNLNVQASLSISYGWRF